MMHSKIRSRMTGLIVLAAMIMTSSVAYAESMTWYVRSAHHEAISLTFYSDDRDHAWPGGDQVYILSDRQRYRYPISCRTGEKICYGAWVRGRPDTYWGVGKDRRFGCSNCCYICDGGQTPTQVLQR